jgi:hypothetical protein
MNKYLPFLFLFFIISITAQIKMESVSSPSTKTENSFYTGSKKPLKPLPFIKLPAGSIKAGGWLAKALQLQSEGLTGHLSEISYWLEKKDNIWLDKNASINKGWEEVPYWLRGYAVLGYLTGNEKIITESKIWIEAVLNNQAEDGFFGPVILRDNGKRDTWANMLMLQVLQDYYEYTGDKRVITFMTNYFKWELNYPEKELLGTYWDTSRGGDNLYSIFWLYNITGGEWLLELAHKIHRITANWSQPDRLPNWHNVNIAECFREPATYYMLSGDSMHLKASYTNFKMIRDIYGQVPGGMFGADENARPGYSDPRQGTETCGFAEQMTSDEILLSITGDPRWADHCEDVAFNSYPASFMPDYKSLRYLTSPNMVVCDSKDHFPGIDNQGTFLLMNPFSYRCCQHNHSHGWPYYVKSLWMATPDNGLAAVLLNNCEVTAKAGSGTEVKIKEITNYPFDDKIIFELSLDKADTFPLYFRIPGWCKNAAIRVNGKTIEGTLEPGNYARIINKWNDKDVIELLLPMELSTRVWHLNKNSISVNYGPLTFSLLIKEKYVNVDGRKQAIPDAKWREDADPEKWPSFEIYPESPWNYGLVTDKDAESSFTIEHRKWPADNNPFTQQTVPIALKAKGKILPGWTIDSTGMCGVLPQSPVSSNEKTEDITLIPMGATRLRISAFPVIGTSTYPFSSSR